MNKQQKIEQLEATINKAAEEIAELKASQEVAGVRWRAEEGERYCAVGLGNYARTCRERNDVVDDRHYESGNYFKTKAEAEAYAAKTLALQKIKDYIAEGNAKEGYIADWNDQRRNKCSA